MTQSFVGSDSFDSNGVRIHFDVYRSGDPVVLVHGATTSGKSWNKNGMAKALKAEGIRVISLDMRGHGRSDKPHDPKMYGYEMSHDIARLLDYLQVDKAHVVGYSQGAIVANRFRVKHPQRLSSLVLGGEGAINEDAAWVRRADEFADSIIAGDLAPIVGALTPPGQEIPSKEQLTKLYFDLAKSNDMKAVAESIRGQGFPDSEEELRSNKVPTLAVIGADDPNKAHVDWMKEIMPNLDVVVVENAGHESVFESSTFIRWTVEFLVMNRL